MAASRLLQLSSSFFLRASRTNLLSLRPSFLPLSIHRPFTVIHRPTLQFFTTGASAASHPWPEWERFVEKLKDEGYFDKAPSAITVDDDAGDGGSATAADATTELNSLKNACLEFARERFDILRLIFLLFLFIRPRTEIFGFR